MFAKLVWQVVHFTFNIPPPTNIKKLFGNGSVVLIKKNGRKDSCRSLYADLSMKAE
jgi:hypothetical protein